MRFDWRHWIQDVGDAISRAAGQTIPDRDRSENDLEALHEESQLPVFPRPRTDPNYSPHHEGTADTNEH